MSHIKQSQQTRNTITKSTQLTNRSQRRDQLELRPLRDRSQADAVQTVVRSVSTRTDAKHTDIGKTTPKSARTLNIDSTNILKRSLSKLRLKDATSPDARRTTAQSKRQPLQPTSRIPQATAPTSSTRIIGARPEQSAFVVHGLAPSGVKQAHTARQDHLHPNATRQQERNENQFNAPAAIQTLSPASPKDKAEVRMKAMQLGIFKISEDDLKERYQFLNEIGMCIAA